MRSTGNLLHEIESSRGTVRAVIEKRHPVATSAAARGNDKTIVVFSGDLDKLIATFVIANGALAMGRRVTIFFTFWGLNALRRRGRPAFAGKSLVEAAFGLMMPKGSRKLALSRMSMGGVGGWLIRGIMRSKHVPTLEEMMGEALRNGARLRGVPDVDGAHGDPQGGAHRRHRGGGVAAYLEASEHADNNLFV